MQFKTDLLKQQFKQVDHRIRVILSFLDLFTSTNFKEEIMITELMRTQQEQDQLYGVGTKKRSVHQYGRGADIRISNFTKAQNDEMLALLNMIPYGKGNYKTAIFHDVGAGHHIHIQVVGV